MGPSSEAKAPGGVRLAAPLCFLLFCGAALGQPSGKGIPSQLRPALFALAQRADPSVRLGPARAALAVYEMELRAKLKGVKKASAKVGVLVDYFFKENHYQASSDLADPSHFYINRVIPKREGYCLSISAVILAVTQRLGLPVRGVAIPRHFFLRYDDGMERINIETTQGGRQWPDSYYRARGVTRKAEEAGVFLRNLSEGEVVAHLLNNEGFIHWQAGRDQLALSRWREALKRHPRLAEAMLNLGISSASRGDSKEAQRFFAKVLVWLPKDVPTFLNRALSSLLAGDPARALGDLDAARRAGGDAAQIGPIRQMVLATLFQPKMWLRHQATIDREAKALQRKGRLIPGLAGSYFRGRDLRTLVARRIDPLIDFEWRWNRPHPRVQRDDFSVRWDGYLSLPEDAHYSIAVVYNDGVRVWVDGVRLIDDWKRNEGGLARESLQLQAGFHRLRVEYFEISRFAGITLKVKRNDAERPLSAGHFWCVRAP